MIENIFQKPETRAENGGWIEGLHGKVQSCVHSCSYSHCRVQGKGEIFKDRGRQIHTSILEPPALTSFMGENRSELETHSGKPLSSRWSIASPESLPPIGDRWHSVELNWSVIRIVRLHGFSPLETRVFHQSEANQTEEYYNTSHRKWEGKFRSNKIGSRNEENIIRETSKSNSYILPAQKVEAKRKPATRNVQASLQKSHGYAMWRCTFKICSKQ